MLESCVLSFFKFLMVCSITYNVCLDERLKIFCLQDLWLNTLYLEIEKNFLIYKKEEVLEEVVLIPLR